MARLHLATVAVVQLHAMQLQPAAVLILGVQAARCVAEGAVARDVPTWRHCPPTLTRQQAAGGGGCLLCCDLMMVWLTCALLPLRCCSYKPRSSFGDSEYSSTADAVAVRRPRRLGAGGGAGAGVGALALVDATSEAASSATSDGLARRRHTDNVPRTPATPGHRALRLRQVGAALNVVIDAASVV